MKYITYRYWFKYGNEDDPMECTTKEWDNLDKAINYAHRYATGIKFASVEIEDENGNLVYRLDDNGIVEDYRPKQEVIFENEETKITLSENERFLVNGVEVVTLVLNKKIEGGFNYVFFEFNSKHSIPEQPFTWQELEILEGKLDYKTKFHLGIIALKNWIKFYLRNGYKVKMRG